MLKTTLLALILFGPSTQESPFNTYSVHTQHVSMPGACAVQDPHHFGNRTYRFRGQMYPYDQPLALRDGRYLERNPDGSVEWETSLGRQESIRLGEAPAVLLRVAASHVGGTGSIVYLLVARCRPKRLEVVFEASGPLTDSEYSAREGLRIAHYMWLPNDCYACPSRKITERYRWDAGRDRFVLIDRAERRIERPDR